MHKTIKNIFLLFLAMLVIAGQAQDMVEVHKNLKKLTSKSFAGRGYVNNGGIKAANFLQNKFKSYGLQPINNSYFQNYTFAINTFPSKIHLKINGKKLKEGQEFTLRANAAASKGESPCLYLPLSDSQKELDLSEYYLIGGVDYEELKKDNLFHSKGFVFLQSQQPQWSVSKGVDTSNYIVFSINENTLADSIKSIQYHFKNKYIPEFETQNIWGFIKGKKHPDSIIIISAHYDHLGMMGKAIYPGANDNASGTSMVLELANYFSKNQPDISLAFVLFSGEEAGLKGSTYMSNHLPFPKEKVALVLNLDMVASGSEGITMVNGKQFPEVFNAFTAINKQNNYLKKVNIRGESCNSDHCPFYKIGIPSVFIYTNGPEALNYHIPQDNYQSLPLTEYEDLFCLIRDFIALNN